MSEPAIPTLAEMLKRVKRSGYRVNNLCHRLDGMWQCNLRAAGPAVSFFAWGYGVDAAHAVEKALEKAHSGKMVKAADVDPDDLDPTMPGGTKDAVAPIPAGELDGPTYSTEPDLDAALVEDAAKIQALGGDPGPTLADLGLLEEPEGEAEDDLIG